MEDLQQVVSRINQKRAVGVLTGNPALVLEAKTDACIALQKHGQKLQETWIDGWFVLREIANHNTELTYCHTGNKG